MAFSQTVKDAAYYRSGGGCEWTRISHGHIFRCGASLFWFNTEFHHIIAEAAGGSDSLSNSEVLCTECHRQTESYGKHY